MLKSKYNSLSEWANANNNAYQAAYKKNLLKDICEMFGWELPRIKMKDGYWTKKRCKEEALKYETRSKWAEYSGGSYSFAKRNGLLEECCGHMIGNGKKK